jgi:UDP-glucose 4-epimerase
MKKGSNILLPGGAGYIGSQSDPVLAKAVYGVTLYDNSPNSIRSATQNQQPPAGPRSCLGEGIVRDMAALEPAPLPDASEVAIHFDGFKVVGNSVQTPIDSFGNTLASAASPFGL